MIEFAGGILEPTRWRSFENLVALASIPSSNDLAREVIDVYFQEEQSLPGTLLRWITYVAEAMTFVRRVEQEEPLSVVPIAVARWTREALKEACGIAAELKWPNDLYVGRRKLAGVLSEARTQGDQAYLAVGIGINVLGRAAEVGATGATTVEEETGRPVPVAGLLHALIDRLDFELARPDWSREVEAWERASLHRPGDRMKVRGDGKELTGQYLGLDASGFLRLKTPAGEAIVASGELDEW